LQKSNAFICILISILASFGACGDRTSIDGFSSSDWISDKKGCSGYRESTVHLLIKNKRAILKQSENELLIFLGKPDRTELMSRNQKGYIYLVRPGGPKCGKSGKTEIDEPYLSIKFNATGIATEIYLI